MCEKRDNLIELMGKLSKGVFNISEESFEELKMTFNKITCVLISN